jgi:hypothetical protein
MDTWEIYSRRSGQTLGQWSGETMWDAYAAMCYEAGAQPTNDLMSELRFENVTELLEDMDFCLDASDEADRED